MRYTLATHRPRRRIAEESSEYADLLSERERLLRRLEIINFWLRGKKRKPKAVTSTAAKLPGYQHTPDSRANMSRAQRARVLSPEAWERIKAGVRKRVFSDEAREKMRAGAKNRVWTPQQRAA